MYAVPLWRNCFLFLQKNIRLGSTKCRTMPDAVIGIYSFQFTWTCQGVLLYKQMKGYYLKDNDADVSNVGPSSEWIRGLWVVGVCMGGGGGVLLVEKWWFRNKFLLMCIVLVLSHYDLLEIPHVARHIPFPALKMEPIYSFSLSHFHPALKMFVIPPRKLSVISYILPNPCSGFLGSIHQQRWYQKVRKTYVQLELQFLFISLTDQIINDHISRQRHFKSHR